MNNLKEYRIKQNLSQEEMADKLGLTQGAIAQWELGITSPPTKKIAQVAELYGCTIEELIEALTK